MRMTEPTHHQIANYLINYTLSELVKYVMEDTGCSIEEAMERDIDWLLSQKQAK